MQSEYYLVVNKGLKQEMELINSVFTKVIRERSWGLFSSESLPSAIGITQA